MLHIRPLLAYGSLQSEPVPGPHMLGFLCCKSLEDGSRSPRALQNELLSCICAVEMIPPEGSKALQNTFFFF